MNKWVKSQLLTTPLGFSWYISNTTQGHSPRAVLLIYQLKPPWAVNNYNIQICLYAATEACDIKWNTAYLENEVLVHQTWMLWLHPYTAKRLLVSNELVWSLDCYNTILCRYYKGYSHVSNFVQLTEEFMIVIQDSSYSSLQNKNIGATCKSTIVIEEEIEHLWLFCI